MPTTQEMQTLLDKESGDDTPVAVAALSIARERDALAKEVARLSRGLDRMTAARDVLHATVDRPCPITGERFFMVIEAPGEGYVPTYGGPYDSFGPCQRMESGELYRWQYDHDSGAWRELVPTGLRVVDESEEQPLDASLPQLLAAMSEEQWKAMLAALDPKSVYRFVEFVRDFARTSKLMLVRKHYAVNAMTRSCVGDWTSNESGELLGPPWVWLGDRIVYQVPPTENGKRVRQTPDQARAWALEQLERDGYSRVGEEGT